MLSITQSWGVLLGEPPMGEWIASLLFKIYLLWLNCGSVLWSILNKRRLCRVLQLTSLYVKKSTGDVPRPLSCLCFTTCSSWSCGRRLSLSFPLLALYVSVSYRLIIRQHRCCIIVKYFHIRTQVLERTNTITDHLNEFNRLRNITNHKYISTHFAF